LDDKFIVFAEMYLAINNGKFNASSRSRCLTSKDIGLAAPKHTFIDEVLEDVFYLEEFDARSHVIEESASYVSEELCEVETLERFLAELSSKDVTLNTILLSLTGAVRENYDGLMKGMDHVRFIKHVLTCGNIQASNMRRKLADTKLETVDDTLQILQTRRRLLRMEKVRDAVNYISKSLKADNLARASVGIGDFTNALALTRDACILLEASMFSDLVIFDAARMRIQAILPKVISTIDYALEKMIGENDTFDENLYADIVMAYLSLDEAKEQEPFIKPLQGLSGLDWRIATHAVARIEAIKNGNKHKVATTTTLLCTLVIKILQIIGACALWHDHDSPKTYEAPKIASGALRMPKYFLSRHDRLKSTGRGLLQTIWDIWHHAWRAVVKRIAASLPVLKHRDDDGGRRPRVADIALALESFEAAQRFATSYGCLDLNLNEPCHYKLVRDIVCVPYLSKLQTEALDSLKQMLSSEPWIRLDVHGDDDPRVAFNDLVLKHEAGSKSPEYIKEVMVPWSFWHTSADPQCRKVAKVILGRHPDKTTLVLEPILIATQAVFHGFQRYALQCVQLTMLLDSVAFNAIETLFELFETYLVAVASVHLPVESEATSPCDNPSRHLAKLLATILSRTARKAGGGLADVEGAIVAAKSLSFASETLSCAANAILNCEPNVHRHTAIRDKLNIYASISVELRTSIFRAVGSRLADINAVVSAISNPGTKVWLGSTIREECNNYVLILINKLSILWFSLVSASDKDIFNDVTRELIWTHTVQATFQAFVDGFSKVEKCSTEGRALMSIDLQVFQSNLDKIHRVRSPRGAAYVDSYIKAWYFSHPDLRAWITQNEGNYQRHHLATLLKAHTGPGGDR